MVKLVIYNSVGYGVSKGLKLVSETTGSREDGPRYR
jgi:hypothetical protein